MHIPTPRIVHPIRSSLVIIIFTLFISRVNGQCSANINTFPYRESFESGTASWISNGINNDWAWGTPAKPVINGAGAGTKCWISGGLTGSFYSFGERSWVESPCFDFTTLNRPFITLLIFWDTERTYDGGNLQYTLDSGNTWITAGNYNDPPNCNTQNWFNHSGITNLNSFVQNTDGWSGTTQTSSGSCSGGGGSGGWKLATHCIKALANKPSVKFRITFGSGTTCNAYDGLAFDDFQISEAPLIADDFSFTCNGINSMLFDDLNSGCHDTWNWNFGDPSSPNNTFTGDHATHQFSSPGIFDVTLTASGSCEFSTQTVKQISILDATSQTTGVTCSDRADGTARINVQFAGAGLSYSWSHNSQLNSSFATGLSSGSYIVTITDSVSCPITIIVDIGFGPGAFPTVSLGEDTNICSGSKFILYPGDYPIYQWQDNSRDSIFIVKEEGTYSVQVRNSFGCPASDTIFVREDCINDIIIPNAFTPNGDGMNEVFFVGGSETYTFKIYIYDRWGQLIFTSANRGDGWDGSFKGRPVQEGIYNYLVDYSIHGEERTKNGSIYLSR